MGSRTLFDAYLFVDWSARDAPSPARESPDAVWVGECSAGGHEPVESYWRTRAACLAYLGERLIGHVAHGHRVLIGFDFPFGYPAGYVEALGLAGTAAPWRL